MAYVSKKYLSSLRYVMSNIYSEYITNYPYHINYDENYNDGVHDNGIMYEDVDILVNYLDIIERGNPVCAKIIYKLLPTKITQYMFESKCYTDDKLEDIIRMHDIGYEFTIDEFDNASNEDNVKTLKYLLSIDFPFTKKQWKKNKKCGLYLKQRNASKK